MAKMQLVFSVMLDEFEWPALEVCSVGIGLLSFSPIGYVHYGAVSIENIKTST